MPGFLLNATTHSNTALLYVTAELLQTHNPVHCTYDRDVTPVPAFQVMIIHALCVWLESVGYCTA